MKKNNLYAGIITIDIDAIAKNWIILKNKLSDNTECSAVVKANAYGIGLKKVSKKLFLTGCNTFFVAFLSEALTLRKILTSKNVIIYVLNGLLPNTSEIYFKFNIRPVLGSCTEINEWLSLCKLKSNNCKAAIHIDTGVNKHGISIHEFKKMFCYNNDILKIFTPVLIISHLVYGFYPNHSMNNYQLNLFNKVTNPLSYIPRSLANSAGIFINNRFHYNLVRPGISLYGGQAISNTVNDIKDVIKIEARIINIKYIYKGQSIGYNAKYTAKKNLKIAILSIGYADGILRNTGLQDDNENNSFILIKGYKAEILGPIFMDMTIINVTNIPEKFIFLGKLIEIIGPNTKIYNFAKYAKTIDYEYFTKIGTRFLKKYKKIK